MAIIEQGDMILASYRRLYEHDLARFFVGTVDAYQDGLIKATGTSFAREMVGGDLVSKPEQRTKLIPVASGTVLVYQLPKISGLGNLGFEHKGHRLYLVDSGSDFRMDLTERIDRG